MLRTPRKADERIAARYVPEGATKEPHDDVGAVVYYFDNRNGKPSAMAYAGTAYKPAFHFRFADEARRAEYVSQWLKAQREACERRAARQQARKVAKHTLSRGDVVYTSWGYDQTNVDFYQVVRVVSDKSVELRQIAQDTTEDGFMCGSTVALKDQFLEGAPMVRRADGEHVSSVDRSGHSATKWDGKPKRCSWYA
jgi:hypothetical protein